MENKRKKFQLWLMFSERRGILLSSHDTKEGCEDDKIEFADVGILDNNPDAEVKIYERRSDD